MKKQMFNANLPARNIFWLMPVIHVLFSLYSQVSYGQKQQAPAPTSAWTTNPFENKEFIENKGQFNSKRIQSNESILYALNQGEVNIYFTAKGLTWRHDDVKEKEESTLKKLFKGSAEEQEVEITTNLVEMRWENPSPDVKVVAEDTLSYYRTY